MYKTILFDFDGTVFDTGPGIMKSVQYAARAFGFQERELREYRRFIGPPLGQSFMAAFGVDEDTANAMVEKFRERYAPIGLNECSPYPGVAGLAGELRAAGRTVVIATAKPTVFARKILESHGMTACFDDILGAETDSAHSVKEQVIAAMLSRHGRDGAVMVGDRDNDVLGAAANSIPCVGVRWGYAEPGELESAGAIAVAGSPEELKAILLGRYV